MDIYREELALAFDGPLEAAAGIPVGLLYGVVLTVALGGGRKALDAVRSSLEAVLGPAQVSKGWFHDRLEFNGSPRFVAEVKSSKVHLQAFQRVKGRQLAEVLRALENIPQTGAVRVRAAVQRYGAPGSRSGPTLE